MTNEEMIQSLRNILTEMFMRKGEFCFSEGIPQEKIKLYVDELSTMIDEIREYDNIFQEEREKALKNQGKRFIKYRPHRGTLADAMMEYKEFFSISEMYDHIIHTNTFQGIAMFEKKDIVITDPIGEDDRIGWKDNRYVCVKRYGDKEYDIPQCIGICSYDDWEITSIKLSTSNIDVSEFYKSVKGDTL